MMRKLAIKGKKNDKNIYKSQWKEVNSNSIRTLRGMIFVSMITTISDSCDSLIAAAQDTRTSLGLNFRLNFFAMICPPPLQKPSRLDSMITA